MVGPEGPVPPGVQNSRRGADTPKVRVDILVLSVALYLWWRARRRCEPALDPLLMPQDDRPPQDVDELPGWLGWRAMSLLGLRSYVGHGLRDIEDYLSGRQENA